MGKEKFVPVENSEAQARGTCYNPIYIVAVLAVLWWLVDLGTTSTSAHSALHNCVGIPFNHLINSHSIEQWQI
jgi:hypothetical protein